MARIDLRDAHIFIMDGLDGSGNLSANAAATDTTLNVETIDLNTTVGAQIPLGARLTVNGETAETVHKVTARTPTTGNTTEVTITPALGAGSYNSGNVEGSITFLPQQLEIKVGEGDFTFTEAKNYDYLLDRGNLDTVREGDEVPLEVSIDCVYEFLKSSSGKDVTVREAFGGIGAASEWVSSSDDKCEPYGTDILLRHCVPCGTEEDEEVMFQDFRPEKKDYKLSDATISVSGKCNISEVQVTRANLASC